MLLAPGTPLLVVHRRLFEKDAPRFFAGRVTESEAGLAEVRGFTWVRDPLSGAFVKKADERTKIVALSAGTTIVYRLPDGVAPEALTIQTPDALSVLLTDGSDFALDLSERQAA